MGFFKWLGGLSARMHRKGIEKRRMMEARKLVSTICACTKMVPAKPDPKEHPLEPVRQNGLALAVIESQTAELCLEAVRMKCLPLAILDIQSLAAFIKEGEKQPEVIVDGSREKAAGSEKQTVACKCQPKPGRPTRKVKRRPTLKASVVWGHAPRWDDCCTDNSPPVQTTRHLPHTPSVKTKPHQSRNSDPRSIL